MCHWISISLSRKESADAGIIDKEKAEEENFLVPNKVGKSTFCLRAPSHSAD